MAEALYWLSLWNFKKESTISYNPAFQKHCRPVEYTATRCPKGKTANRDSINTKVFGEGGGRFGGGGRSLSPERFSRLYTVTGKGTFVAERKEVYDARAKELLTEFDEIVEELFFLSVKEKELVERMDNLAEGKVDQ